MWAGTEAIRKAGATISGGNVAFDLGANAAEGAQVIAHEKVLNRVSAPTGKQSVIPTGAGLPTRSSTMKRSCFSMARALRLFTCPTRIPMATASCFSGARM